ncbi:MAG TPA: efflux RND transporter periplasmic adaptor subunit [Gemmatimonadaceae bacterium]|nr:efflux RND transporter periplasmic adaptor subunit [Gemmatimonadaceae bacterium]
MTISVPRTLPLATLLRLGAAATLGVLLAGCAKTEPPPPPPPEVRVVAVESRPISNVIEVPGRLQAVRTADVRARVDGIVERRVYAEGSDVRAGQALFAIDPLPLRARLGAAEAALARAEATAANAAQDVKRYDGLVGKQAISQQEYDAAVARLRTAEADVAAARAQVETARLNLGYATVTAPISGRAGRAAVTEGALVSAGAGTLLTRIEQLDPLFVNFSQSNAELLAVRQAMARGEGKGRVSVRLVLDNGSTYDRVGRLDFLDLSIDEATGTAALRAEMPNPDRLLLPGQFVRVRIELGEPVEGLAVPQRAVTVGATGKSVMVVGADGKAERREVTLGELQGDAWIVLSGLTEGERVITDGIQKVQPGQPVRLAAEQTSATGELSATRADSAGKAAS